MTCDGTVLLVVLLAFAVCLAGWYQAYRNTIALERQVAGLTRRLREAEE